MQPPTNELSTSIEPFPPPSSAHDDYFHNFGVALDLQARGFHISGMLRTAPDGSPPVGEATRVPLTEVIQYPDRRYNFYVDLDPSAQLNLVELLDPRTAVLGPVFLPRTGLTYGIIGAEPTRYAYAVSPPLLTEEVSDPLAPETRLFMVSGVGKSIPLPSSPPHTGWVVYGMHDLPTRLHPEGFSKALGVLFAASALAHACARHDRAAAFAKALTDVLRAHQWTPRSAQLFVAYIARVAGDTSVAQMAIKGRFLKRPWLDEEHAFQVLGGSADDPQWSRVREGLLDDPRTIQRRFQLDHFATIAFVEMVEDMERHVHSHRGL